MIIITVQKSKRMLTLCDDGKIIAKMKLSLGFSPGGHKLREGDGRTPEGAYFVCTRNANSKYYKSLGLSYPNLSDAYEGLYSGVIDKAAFCKIKSSRIGNARPPWDTPLGGFIMIHGAGSHGDWTAGCIAVDNSDMDILWEYCDMGTKVIIYK